MDYCQRVICYTANNVYMHSYLQCTQRKMLPCKAYLNVKPVASWYNILIQTFALCLFPWTGKFRICCLSERQKEERRYYSTSCKYFTLRQQCPQKINARDKEMLHDCNIINVEIMSFLNSLFVSASWLHVLHGLWTSRDQSNPRQVSHVKCRHVQSKLKKSTEAFWCSFVCAE